MDKFIKIIHNFSKVSILVIGDIMLDEYLLCNVTRISPEAPVPVASVYEKKHVLGGAANVANNLSAFGVKVDLIGVVGEDDFTETLKLLLQNSSISTDNIIIDNSRPTTVKSRILAGNQQLIRLDREKKHKISQNIEEEIIKRVLESIDKYNVIIFSDYAKGVLTQTLIERINAAAKDRGIKTLVDPVPQTFSHYKGTYLIKPNKKEAEEFAGVLFGEKYENKHLIRDILKSKSEGANLIITLGKDGMIVFNGEEEVQIPTKAQEVYDVSGAGDTVMAAIAASISTGANLVDAAHIGNIAASIVLRKIGTATCTRQELLDEINSQDE